MSEGFQHDDGGRAAAGFKGSAGDCVVRAVAIASGRSYAEIYRALADGNGSERSIEGRVMGRTARDGIHVRRQWFKDYMRSLGFVWTPTMGIGTGCKVHLCASELPSGRLVVSVSKHYTAMIDGVVHDTHDPRERGTTIYSPNTPKDRMPKSVYWLQNGNGWAYSPQRCVYGYWSLA